MAITRSAVVGLITGIGGVRAVVYVFSRAYLAMATCSAVVASSRNSAPRLFLIAGSSGAYGALGGPALNPPSSAHALLCYFVL